MCYNINHTQKEGFKMHTDANKQITIAKNDLDLSNDKNLNLHITASNMLATYYLKMPISINNKYNPIRSVKDITYIFNLIFIPRAYFDCIVVCDFGVDILLDKRQFKKFVYEKIKQLGITNCSKYIISEYVKQMFTTPLPIHINTQGNNVLFLNGIYDLSYNTKFVQFPFNFIDRPYPFAYRINAKYIENLDTEKAHYAIDSFLATLTQGNTELTTLIWQMIGYLLVPDHTPKKVFLIQEKGDSGGILLAKIIASLFETNNVSFLNINQLKSSGVYRELEHKSLNISFDTPDETIPSSAICNINPIVNTLPIDVEYAPNKFRKMFRYAKFLLLSKSPLALKSINADFGNRIINIPLYESGFFHDETTVHNTIINNQHERDYIATRAVNEYIALRNNNYEFSSLSFQHFPYYIQPNLYTNKNSIIVKNFVNDCCEIVYDYTIITYSAELYKRYIEYCKNNNFTYVEDVKSFSKILNMCFGDRIIKTKRRNKSNNTNANGYRGIRLLK